MQQRRSSGAGLLWSDTFTAVKAWLMSSKQKHTKENRKHSIDVSGKIPFPFWHTVLAEVINAPCSNKPPYVSERYHAASFLSSIRGIDDHLRSFKESFCPASGGGKKDLRIKCIFKGPGLEVDILTSVQTLLVRTSHMVSPILKKAGSCSLYVQEKESVWWDSSTIVSRTCTFFFKKKNSSAVVVAIIYRKLADCRLTVAQVLSNPWGHWNIKGRWTILLVHPSHLAAFQLCWWSGCCCE